MNSTSSPEIFAPLATAPGAFGLKDDAAVDSAPGRASIWSSPPTRSPKARISSPTIPPARVAQKALRVNLSDLAAKGAKPEYYLLNLALPPADDARNGWRISRAGLAEDQEQFGISLLGGDTGHAKARLTITVTAFGFVPEGRMVKRSGAKSGDAVYVTGTIGDSGGGLALFKREKHAAWTRRTAII